jgi:transcriptional regulator with XRE-family HTH domain
MTRHKISALMRGAYDPTITELQRLAKTLGVTVVEVCSHKEAHVAG